MNLVRKLTRPIPADSLVVFRILFGLMIAFGGVRFLAYGWVEKLYAEPTFFFTYSGFSWVHPWNWGGNTLGMKLHFIALVFLALFIAAGFFYRLSTFLFFIGFTYVELIDKSNYLNHYYFISIIAFLMIFMPLHRNFSLDVWRKPVLKRNFVPAWCLSALQFQIALVYFFAGLAKINSDWLLKAQPLKIWLSANTDFPLLGSWFAQKEAAYIMSWAGMMFDLTIPFFLLWKKSQPWAYVAVVGFHLMTWLLFPIGLFPWVMIISTLVFFSSTWPRKLFPHFFKPKENFPSTPPEPVSVVEKTILVFLAAHFAVQIFLPLRNYFYPTNVFWSEEAYRFSWRVMLIEKTGSIEYEVRDPTSGKIWAVPAKDYLKPYQEKQMSTQPDMILTLAKKIAADFREKGYPNIEVRALSYASLNGRLQQPFVDPNVDLARVEDHFWKPRNWILSLQK